MGNTLNPNAFRQSGNQCFPEKGTEGAVPFFRGIQRENKTVLQHIYASFLLFSLDKVVSLTCFPIYHAILWYN